jgi:peptidyl-prolyl cis-trans isomerase D
MLRGIRQASSNWLGKTIMTVAMGALIVSFGVWGIADIFRGFGQGSLAKVGHTEISANEFRQIYTDRLQQIGRQFGRPLTQEQARALGLDRKVLQQIIGEAALDEKARQLGLGQSNAETMRQIFADPNFKGMNGQFDAQRFQAIIRNFGYTEARYLADQKRISLRHQLTNTITAGLSPSNTLMEALNRFQNEQRSAEYVRLGAAQAGTIDPPSPETLASYFDEHKAQFRAPEYRKIAYVAVTPEDIGKWSDVSDEDAKKLFEQRKNQLGTPEKRQVSQIVFPNMEEAQAARSRIASGTSFEDIAKERKLADADIDLGLVTKSAILDPAIANAAFSLPSGEVSQPVQGKFGIALVEVGVIQPGIEPDYASVATDLKKEIAIERARNQVATLRDKMEDERGGGASVTEAAQKLGLKAVTIEAVDRSGKTPSGERVNIPPGLDVVSQAFNTDVGADNDAISYRGGYVWYEVLGITPPRDRTLDEVKDQVEARWKDEQIANRLRTKATEMVSRLEQGGKLADEAASAGTKVETAANFKREDSPSGVPSSLIAAAFRTAKDGVGQTPASGNEWIVFRVTDITVPPVDFNSEDMKKLKDQLVRSLSEEQVALYVARLEKDIGTSINEAAFAQVTGAANNE